MSASDPRHLSLDELDLVRSGEAPAEHARHAASCAVCRAELMALESLAREIQGSQRPAPAIPASVDRAVLASARSLLAPASRRRRVLLRRSASLAAAALLAAAGLRFWLGGGDPWDIDRSGTVDIVDAYSLAVRLKSGVALDRRWDLNTDGAVNSGDVEAIARQAVRLERRSP